MPDNEIITAKSLNVTKFAGWGSFIGGVIAAAAAALGEINGTLPAEIQLGLLGLAAVALVVVGAVVIADMRVRKELTFADMASKNKEQTKLFNELRKDMREFVGVHDGNQ